MTYQCRMLAGFFSLMTMGSYTPIPLSTWLILYIYTLILLRSRLDKAYFVSPAITSAGVLVRPPRESHLPTCTVKRVFSFETSRITSGDVTPSWPSLRSVLGPPLSWDTTLKIRDLFPFPWARTRVPLMDPTFSDPLPSTQHKERRSNS